MVRKRNVVAPLAWILGEYVLSQPLLTVKDGTRDVLAASAAKARDWFALVMSYAERMCIIVVALFKNSSVSKPLVGTISIIKQALLLLPCRAHLEVIASHA